nr:hypothetical protein [uncultured Dyadobacter sp.]
MNIYLIAGPPGIGKSTYGREFVPQHIPIVDHDLAAYQYKKKGFSDYSELASLKANEFIQSCLKNSKDFALELNLGYASHYDYAKSFSSATKDARIHLILFFTDHVDLCLLRARVRSQNGGHLVKPEVIREMYRNTIWLLKKNGKMFFSFTFISVTDEEVEEVTISDLPAWIEDNCLEQLVRP